jgi:integrase/recombinase XerD
MRESLGAATVSLGNAAATLSLEARADVRYIQGMLGHAKRDTTQLHAQVSIQKLKGIHDATHPAAKVGRKGEDEVT